MLLNTAVIILLLSAIALTIKTFLNFDQAKLNDLNRIAPSADLTGFTCSVQSTRWRFLLSSGR